MRATGTTMISRDSIVYPMMAGGSKGEIKEGCLAALQMSAAFVQSGGLTTPTARRLQGLAVVGVDRDSPVDGWVGVVLPGPSRSKPSGILRYPGRRPE